MFLILIIIICLIVCGVRLENIPCFVLRISDLDSIIFRNR